MSRPSTAWDLAVKDSRRETARSPTAGESYHRRGKIETNGSHGRALLAQLLQPETPSCVNDACVCLSNTDCDDGNDCTDDVCNVFGACDHDPVPDQTACEDGLFCTKNDECDAFGTCVGGSGNPCKGNEICCECLIEEDGHCVPIGFQCSCPSS